MAQGTINLYNKLKKGGDAETVRTWLDGFVYRQVWEIFNRLAEADADLNKLLEVQAEAKIILAILAELGNDRILAMDADKKLAKILENQVLPR